MSAKKWICQTDKSHVFDEATDDYFCPSCPARGDIGILILESVAQSHVTITTPVNNQKFNEGATMNIIVDVAVANGNITKNELYDNDKKMDEVSSPPYSFNYPGIS